MIREMLARATKAAAVAGDAVAKPPAGLTTLAYHRIGGGSELQLDIEPAVFDEQMAHLADVGTAVDLDELLGESSESGSSDRPELTGRVAVTFDDGTSDFIDHALPSLVHHRIPATYYIATDFIERQQPFPNDGHPMSWSGLAEALSTGLVTVGSHTHSHAVMANLDPTTADQELARAVGLIQDRLGVSPDHFAYPKGVFGGDAIEQLVANYHHTAALADSRTFQPTRSSLLRLGRTPVQRNDGLGHFIRKAQGGLRLEGAMRGGLNKVRYRHARN